MDEIKALLKQVLVQNDTSSPDNMDSPKAQDPTTMVPAIKKAPQLEGRHSTKIGGMWNLKYEITRPKFYELLINTERKGDTALYPKNFYKHNKIFPDAVTRLQ